MKTIPVSQLTNETVLWCCVEQTGNYTYALLRWGDRHQPVIDGQELTLPADNVHLTTAVLCPVTLHQIRRLYPLTTDRVRNHYGCDMNPAAVNGWMETSETVCIDLGAS